MFFAAVFLSLAVHEIFAFQQHYDERSCWHIFSQALHGPYKDNPDAQRRVQYIREKYPHTGLGRFLRKGILP